MGWLSPLAVSAPDESSIAYNAWVNYKDLDSKKSLSAQSVQSGEPVGRPSIRFRDLTSGRDELIEDGAFSIAWNGDGRFAYFKGIAADFRVNEPYPGHIVVRADLSSPPVPWTVTPGEYVVVAWAHDDLIAYERLEGGDLNVVILTGPGRQRTLAESAQVVAVSPDATKAILDVYGSGSSVATLVDLRSGRELSTIDFGQARDPATGEPLGNLGYGGSWTDDRVVAHAGPGVVILNTNNDALTLEGILQLQNEFPQGVH